VTSPALADDANALLEYARSEARRRGHVEVTPEHVLIAVLDTKLGLQLAARRGVDYLRLETVLESRVGALVTGAAYRDAPQACPLSAALGDLLARAARDRRILLLRRPVRAVDVIVGLFAALADVVEECTFGSGAIERLADAAAKIAAGFGHRNVLLDHAVLAFFDLDPSFVLALKALGHEPDAVRGRIERRLREPRLRSHLLAPLPNLLEVASLRTTASAAELGIGAIVVDLLRHPSGNAALQAADVNRYDLLHAFAHGCAPSATTFDRTDETVDVVFYDDSYTTMEFVLAVLENAFGMSAAEAKRKMFAVHEKGSAVVATLPRDRAMASVIRARGAARDELMPLRIEIVQSVALSILAQPEET
jgi:ATP-dependent Clp protease adaptor protein ClpS